MTEPLVPGEIRTGDAYEAERGDARHLAMEQRRLRRVDLGERLSVVFENRDSLRAAAEELLRAERIADAGRVAGEIATFNAVVPTDSSLLAMLYLEVSDAADLPAVLTELEGLARHVYLEIAGSRAAASVDDVPEDEQRAPAVLLSIPLTEAQREAWREGATVAVGVDHPRHRVVSPLSDEQRALIAQDL